MIDKKSLIKIIVFIFSIIIVLIFSMTIRKKTISFETLQDIQKYAATYPENVKSDNNDWVDPEFIGFYKKHFSISWLSKILRGLGVQKKLHWNAARFKDRLKRVTQHRLSKNLKAPHYKTIQLNQINKVFLFGDLQGAFHSMSRDLTELKKLGEMSDNIEVKNKNTYIVIIGDAISRSPYSLELFDTILALMEKNPEHVIYLRGNHEKKNYWENFSMERELKFKAASIPSGKISKAPLKKEINSFFGTLPDALIIKNSNNPQEKIIISHSKVKSEIYSDPHLRFIIVGEKRLEVIKETKGLEFIGYDKGAAKWSVISCPTTTYQKFFNLFYDSFVEITFGKKFKHSILTLHSHDVRNSNGYKETYYDPTFAFQLKEKKSILGSREVVKVGSSMYLTGVNWDLGKEIKSGVETAIYNHNQKKPQILIRPYFLDDGYNPRKTFLNINILKEKHDIDKILMPTGTPTLAVYLDKVKKGELSVFFPATGDLAYRKPDIKNIVHLRATYIEEAKKLLNYLIKGYGIKRFALFYQTYGQPIADALHEEMKKHGITKWLDLPHLSTQENFSNIAAQIKNFVPEAIGCFSSQLPTQRLVSTLGSRFFLKHLLFMPPSLYTRNFKKFLESRGIKYVMVSMVPDPLKSNIEIAKEHLETMKQRGLIPTIHSLSGYIAGALFANAVNKVQPPVTKEKLISYFENLKDYNFKGVNIKFNPQTRSLTKDIWIKSSEDTWTKPKKKVGTKI